jgi:ubiquinone/menaquinone biosynthesis C-methylase UbiE
MWDKGWDILFSRVEWGRYPGEELIRFVARNFYSKHNRKDIKILEVGCGSGANLWYLAREGFKTYGFDGSSVAIEKAENFLKKENLTADLKQGDALNLPYDDAMFDAVLDVECLYANSLVDTSVILKEIYRVLKPGGLIYSKTFSVGMSGEKTGLRMTEEPNTFLEMPDGPLHKEYGIIRLTSEKEIPKIYHLFSEIEYDYISRTDKNRSKEILEWVIQGRKGILHSNKS